MPTPLRVLHIEDQEDDVALVRRALTRGGYEVTVKRVETAADMRAALTPLPGAPRHPFPLSQRTSLGEGEGGEGWDIILCDHAMPQFSSTGALEVYRELGLDIPFIVVTGTVGEEYAVTAMKNGAHDFILKDSLARLAAAVARELREAEVRRQRREAEQQRNLILASAGEGIYGLDLQGNLTFVNPAAAAMFGFRPEELIGQQGHAKHHHTRADGTPYPREECPIYAAFHDGLTHRVDDEVFWRKDGTSFPVEYTSTPILEDGRLTGAVVTFNDLTERKRAEEALARSESLLIQTGEIARVGGWELDLETNTLYWSLETYRIHEVDPSVQPNVESAINFYAPEARPIISAAVRQAAEDGKPWDLELPFITATGRPLWVRAQGQAEVRNGKSVRIFGAFQDITERKRAEEALRASEERFRSVAQSASDAIIIADSRGLILSWNKGAQAMFGRSDAEALGQPVAILMPERFREAHRQGLERIRDTGQTQYIGQTLELVGLRQDGSEFPLEISVALWKAGAETFYSSIIRDITERKRAEEQIRLNAARAEALARTAARLNAQLDLATVLQAVCEEAAAALRCEVATLDLLDASADVLRCSAIHGLPPDFLRRHTPTPRAAFEAAAHFGPTLVIPDIQKTDAVSETASVSPDAALYAELNARTVVVAGMRREARLVGTLNVVSIGQPRAFTADELALLQGLADQAAQAITNARLYEETQRRLSNVQALRAIDAAITSSLDLRLTLNVVLNQVVTQLKVDAADVLLLDPAGPSLEYAVGLGFRTERATRARLRLGESQAGRAALERRTIAQPEFDRVEDIFEQPHLLAGEGFHAYFAAPLLAKGQVRGVLEVFLRSHRVLDDEWLGFLETLAEQTAVAIENAQLFDGLQRSNAELVAAYDTTLEGWSRAMDLRDKETEGHTQRVTEMTVSLARAMGMTAEELVHIRRGALLHDMGKLGVPDAILLKLGKLTDEEWVIMKKHPTFAYEMLAPIPYLREALDIPYCHHEKWDGTGYPRRLKGEQIPLAARLFAVVDVYDALTSDRPYQEAWTKEKTLEHIQSGAGTHFDPRVVEAFLRMQEAESSMQYAEP